MKSLPMKNYTLAMRRGQEYGEAVANAVHSGGEFPEPPAGMEHLKGSAIKLWNRHVSDPKRKMRYPPVEPKE